jgi:hypothetical protein
MIQLPQRLLDKTTIGRAISAANQLLVDKGDYKLVEALLRDGKTVRFRLPCDEIQPAVCPMCVLGTEEDCVNLLDYLFDYLDDRIKPGAGVWALGFGCIPTEGGVDVVLEPTGM